MIEQSMCECTGTLPKIKPGEWTHLVATYKNGQPSQICMTSAISTKGATVCDTYIPANTPIGSLLEQGLGKNVKRGSGLPFHFNLGGCQSWRRHEVDVDIAVVNVYNHQLTQSTMASKYTVLKDRGQGQHTAVGNAFAPTNIGFSTVLGVPGQMEGCFGTVDFEKQTDTIPFAIDPTSGQLSTTEPLDYEQQATWHLHVQLLDDGGRVETIRESIGLADNAQHVQVVSVVGTPLSTSCIVTVTVLDQNEKPIFAPTCTTDQAQQVLHLDNTKQFSLQEYTLSLSHQSETGTQWWMTIDVHNNTGLQGQSQGQSQEQSQGSVQEGSAAAVLLHRSPLQVQHAPAMSTFQIVSGLYHPAAYSISWSSPDGDDGDDGNDGDDGGTPYYLTTDSSNYRYVGCYTDNRRRDLKFGPRKYGYTADSCRTACVALTYTYFSLQHGGQCFCDNSYSTPSTYRQTNDEECHRNGGYRNGGAWRNAVFKILPGHQTPQNVRFTTYATDTSYAKAATWSAVDAVDGHNVYGRSRRISLHTMDTPPLYLVQHSTSADTGTDTVFALMPLEQLDTPALKQAAVFQVNAPLTQPEVHTLETRIWMSHVGTENRQRSRRCSLQPFRKTHTAQRGYDGRSYTTDWYRLKWNCGSGNVGVPLYMEGNRMVGTIGHQRCALDVLHDSEDGAEGEEHAAVLNCHADAQGVPVDVRQVTKGRVYGLQVGEGQHTCGLVWHMEFQSEKDMTKDETMATMNCAGRADAVTVVPRSKTGPGHNSMTALGACIAVEEHTAAGTMIGDPMSAYDDDDHDHGGLTFALANAPSGTSALFHVHPNTGQISILNAALLNFESISISTTVVLTLSVSDNHPTNPMMAQRDVLIVIQDKNESPQFGTMEPFTVKENADPGTELGWSAAATATVEPGSSAEQGALLRGTVVLGSSQVGDRQSANQALDNNFRTAWHGQGQEHWLWVDLHHVHSLDRVVFTGGGRFNVELQTADRVVNQLSNWWSVLDVPGSWALAPAGHAISGLYRSQCDDVSCLEQAMTNAGLYSGGRWVRLLTKGTGYSTAAASTASSASDVASDVATQRLAFDAAFVQSSYQLLHRHCSSCQSTHQNIYYHRLTPLPVGFSIYDTTQITWSNANNKLGVDFNLYSSLEDALNQKNPWLYCNYNDNNIGFPRDCGPEQWLSNQWQSQTRGGQPNLRWSVYVNEVCVEVPFDFGTSNTWHTCPTGHYISGVHSDGTLDKLRCCPETGTSGGPSGDATEHVLAWGKCNEVAWNGETSRTSSTSTVGSWSVCPDRTQLVGLHVEDVSCSGASLNCIDRAQCCAYTSRDHSAETTYEATIAAVAGQENTMTTAGTTTTQYLKIMLRSTGGDGLNVVLPDIQLFGTRGEHSDSSIPWEPHVLLETGRYKVHRGNRPTTAQQVLEAVGKADYSARRYCTREIEGMTEHSNRRSCGGGSKRHIAYRVTHTFSFKADAVFNFRFGTDFGHGGVVEIDGHVVSSFHEDLWWKHNWAHPDATALSVVQHRFDKGNHRLVVSGLEPCCGGTSTYQFQPALSGTDTWMDLTIANLKAFSGSGLTAMDPDQGAYGRLSYALTTPSSLFALDAQRGQLTTSLLSQGLIDYEQAHVHTVPVTVTDGGGLTARTNVVIQVLNVNEPPYFVAHVNDVGLPITRLRLSLPENTVPGTAIGQVHAVDPDENQLLSFAWKTGGVHPWLTIVECDGTIGIGRNVLDYETTPSLTVQVQVHDDGAPFIRSSVLELVIEVVDQNEPPTLFASALSVPENSPQGTVLGGVNATDPDAQDVLTYLVLEEFPASARPVFHMSTVGDLVVSVPSALDYETQEDYAVTVQVRDKGGLTADALIHVRVTDRNEGPTFSNTGTVAVMVENSPEGTTVGHPVEAVDPDIHDFGTLTYSITTNVPSLRPLPSRVNYTFALTTANFLGAGTRDAVQVRLSGSVAVSDWVPVSTGDGGGGGGSGELLTQLTDGSVQHVVVEIKYIGALTSLQFRTMGSDGWMLSRVEVGRVGHSHPLVIESESTWVQGQWSIPDIEVSPCLLMDPRPLTTAPDSGGGFSCPPGYVNSASCIYDA